MASTTSVTTTGSGIDWDYVHKLQQANKWLVILMVGAIIVFGVVGNILAIITLRARPFRMFQSTFLLIALACSDIGVLCTNALYEWLGSATDADIALSSRAVCKLGPFAGSLAVMVSAWTLVLITLERMISVLRPDMVHLFSVNRIRIGWSAMVGVLIISQLYVLILFDIYNVPPSDHLEANNGTSRRTCNYSPKNVDQIEYYNFWSDLFIASVIPCLLIFTFNAIIIKRLTGPTRQFGDRAMIPQPTKKPSSITVMLVVVSIVFLVTTLPLRVYQVGYRAWWSNLDKDPAQSAKDHMTASLLSFLYYTNNGINFILYMMVNPTFRRAFLGVFCCQKQDEEIEENIGEPITSDHILQGAGYGSGTTEQEQLVQ